MLLDQKVGLIKDVIRPESRADQSKEKLEEVLQSVLMETWNTRSKAKENEQDNETSKEKGTIGSVGWWEGPLGERYVAVVLDKDTWCCSKGDASEHR